MTIDDERAILQEARDHEDVGTLLQLEREAVEIDVRQDAAAAAFVSAVAQWPVEGRSALLPSASRLATTAGEAVWHGSSRFRPVGQQRESHR